MFSMNRVFLILLVLPCVGTVGYVLGDSAPPEFDSKRHPVSDNNNDWQLKFNDEFDGTDLDLTRFSPSLTGVAVSMTELVIYLGATRRTLN